jgi:hypothetical protein
VVGAVLTGFVIGFAAGTLGGAVLGTAARHLNPDFHVQPGPVLQTGGALVGVLVGQIVGSWPGMVAGTVVGAAGAGLWGRLCHRLELAEQSARHSSLESEDLLGME